MGVRPALLILFTAMIAAPEAHGQAYHPACQDLQIRELESRLANLGDDATPEQKARLEQSLQEAQSFIDRGKAVNERLSAAVQDARLKTKPIVDSNAELTESWYGFLELAKRAKQTRSLEDVRAAQKARVEHANKVENKYRMLAISDPRVDVLNGEAQLLQKESNTHEETVMLRRLYTPISREAWVKAVKKVLGNEAAPLNLGSDDIAQIRENEAWSQAVGAYGAFKAVAEDGYAPDEILSAMGGSIFDSDANIVRVAGAELVSQMGIQGVSQGSGGFEGAVNVRKSFGPKTRQAVSLIQGESLNKRDRAMQVRERIAKALALPRVQTRVSTEIKEPPPPPIDTSAPMENKMTQVEKRVDEAKQVLKNVGSVFFDTTLTPPAPTNKQEE